MTDNIVPQDCDPHVGAFAEALIAGLKSVTNGSTIHAMTSVIHTRVYVMVKDKNGNEFFVQIDRDTKNNTEAL